jgi:hypothetical protein
MDRTTPFDSWDDDAQVRGDVQRGNPIALMILAEWVLKRDQEDPVVEHGFRIVRG